MTILEAVNKLMESENDHMSFDECISELIEMTKLGKETIQSYLRETVVECKLTLSKGIEDIFHLENCQKQFDVKTHLMCDSFFHYYVCENGLEKVFQEETLNEVEQYVKDVYTNTISSDRNIAKTKIVLLQLLVFWFYGGYNLRLNKKTTRICVVDEEQKEKGTYPMNQALLIYRNMVNCISCVKECEKEENLSEVTAKLAIKYGSMNVVKVALHIYENKIQIICRPDFNLIIPTNKALVGKLEHAFEKRGFTKRYDSRKNLRAFELPYVIVHYVKTVNSTDEEHDERKALGILRNIRSRTN